MVEKSTEEVYAGSRGRNPTGGPNRTGGQWPGLFLGLLGKAIHQIGYKNGDGLVVPRLLCSGMRVEFSVVVVRVWLSPIGSPSGFQIELGWPLPIV